MDGQPHSRSNWVIPHVLKNTYKSMHANTQLTKMTSSQIHRFWLEVGIRNLKNFRKIYLKIKLN